MNRLLFCSVILTALPSCSSGSIKDDVEVQDCSEADLELMERAISDAMLIESYMDETLAHRFTGDLPSYGSIVDRLVEVYSQGEIHCGVSGDEMDYCWTGFVFDRRSIMVNVESETWADARDAWESGQEYGRLSADEVGSRVSQMDDVEYAAFKDVAWAYLHGPYGAVSILTHESAHLVTPHCCSHPHGESGSRERDFVDAVGIFARHGLYW